MSAVAEVAVTFSVGAVRDLRKLDPPVQSRIVKGINRYAKTGAGEVKRIEGRLRLRVGDWRVFFARGDDNVLEIDAILHRREAYR